MKLMKLFIALLFVAGLAYAQTITYPKTKKVDHVDVYHGTEVADPYRWMEANDAPELAEWVEQQNDITFAYLEKIPYREALKKRLTEVWNYPRYSAPRKEGDYWYFSKNDGLQNQSVIYRQKELGGQAEVFLDPNSFSEDGTVALAGAAFSKDGRYYAYALTRSGSDWRDIYVMDTKTKELLPDNIEWAKFTGISWQGDGFYYSRYDAPAKESDILTASNEFHKVFFHRLGTPQSEDKLVYEDMEHPKRNFGVGVTEDERFSILTGFQGGEKGNPLFVRDHTRKDPQWMPIVVTYDHQFGVIRNVGSKLLVFTNYKAPKNRVVLIDPEDPAEESWKEIIPEKEEVLSDVTDVGGKLLTVYIKDASHRAYVYAEDGTLERELTLPALGTVGFAGGKREDTHAFYVFTSFTYPSVIYRMDLASGTSEQFRASDYAMPTDGYVTQQVFYKSKDGTSVPMFIVHKEGIAMDGSNPTILYGYGGFNISILPSFSTARMVWLETGGVYAVANIRGGGEYGEDWHEAGTKLQKQNVFDDFIAAGEHLIAQKYTSPKKLAIEGASNGGLLVGAVLNQRPDLFAVGLPAVGVMDMLRFHTFTIGWAWTRDYGSSDDSVQFSYLRGYSPLHNIKAADYPAVLVTTADHDDRVVPAHSFKYIATLQERHTGKSPVLIRIETKAGHGGGKPTSKIIEEVADKYAFTLYNMGVKEYRAGGKDQ